MSKAIEIFQKHIEGNGINPDMAIEAMIEPEDGRLRRFILEGIDLSVGENGLGRLEMMAANGIDKTVLFHGDGEFTTVMVGDGTSEMMAVYKQGRLKMLQIGAIRMIDVGEPVDFKALLYWQQGQEENQFEYLGVHAGKEMLMDFTLEEVKEDGSKVFAGEYWDVLVAKNDWGLSIWKKEKGSRRVYPIASVPRVFDDRVIRRVAPELWHDLDRQISTVQDWRDLILKTNVRLSLDQRLELKDGLKQYLESLDWPEWRELRD